MGLYSTCIFPFFLDLMLDNEFIRRERRETLAPLYGSVLEIGFGTGLNLTCYPQQVTKLTVIDSERMLAGRVGKRINAAGIPVQQMKLDAGGRLPFEDNSFDGVATTLTLCSIENVSAALAEIRRVLKTEGRYVFLEHGRSRDPQLAKRQDRFNPIQKLIACGCNMNRPIDRLIENAGLNVAKLERYSMPGSPRILSEMYRGVAQK
ncbi:MAG: class I SAM-dependent methyltransferase [Blastocatellia bacterium]